MYQFIIKDYINANITYVNDLLENDMSFKSIDKIKEIVGESANFLNYGKLMHEYRHTILYICKK